MSVIQLPIQRCLECGLRATRTLGLMDFDAGKLVEPKYYCAEHFPAPLDEDGLRLLLDQRDTEIESLRAALKPFAAIPLWRDQYPDAKRDELGAQQMRGFVRVEDVRAARAALAVIKSSQETEV